jgi:hypothetical protein
MHTRSHASVAFRRERRGQPCRNQSCNRTINMKGAWLGYCGRCAQAYRRHGHVSATGVRVAELAPYLKLVRNVRKRNPGIDWTALHSRWRTVVDYCRSEANRSGVYIAYERKAAQLVVQIADAVDTDRLIDLTAAVYMLQEFQPSRFRTDDCFDFALGHVLRREAGAGRRFKSQIDGTTKAHYREMGRRTRRRLGELIRQGLGLVGLHIAQLERKRLTARSDQEAAFKATVAAIA